MERQQKPAWVRCLGRALVSAGAIGLVVALAFCLRPRYLAWTRSDWEPEWHANMQVLMSLRRAEDSFRTRSVPGRYGDLTELKAAGLSPLAEGETLSESGYVYTSVAGAEDYTIVAIPPRPEMTTYSLMETGDMKP